MTASQIIAEIQSLTPEEQAGVVRFVYQLDAERDLNETVPASEGALRALFDAELALCELLIASHIFPWGALTRLGRASRRRYSRAGA